MGTAIARLLLLAAGVGVPLLVLRNARRRKGMRLAPVVDLERYAGRWYEIARMPNRFERHCERDVTATYTLRADGGINVLNECVREDGTYQSVSGKAWPDGSASALKVQFFWPFTGDYWIIDLDPGYRWALVGEPGRDNLWVLSRSPHMEEKQLARILRTAAAEGFDVSRVIRTPQTQRMGSRLTIS